MNLELRQPSSHLERKDKKENDWLENFLEDWGAWMRKGCPELETPQKTSLKVAEEMRPEQMRAEPGRYYDEDGDLYPKKIRRLIDELRGRKNHKTTRYITGTTPNYMPHHRLDQLNRIIQDLPHEYYVFLHHRFEMEIGHEEWSKMMNLSHMAYYRRLKQAKKLIRKSEYYKLLT